MGGRMRVSESEAKFLAEEDATQLWALIRNEQEFFRRPPKKRGDMDYNHRLLYLMAVAVFRTVGHLVAEPRWHRVLDTAEAYADGKADVEEFFEACDQGGVDCRKLSATREAAADSIHLMQDDYKVLRGVALVSDSMGYLGATEAGVLKKNAKIHEARAVWKELAFLEAKHTHEKTLCSLIRDIFGNPYRPVPLEPACRTPKIVAIAEGLYDEKDFDSMGILADALEDVGCDGERLLEHLRMPGPHVRGCWALDLVLGRE